MKKIPKELNDAFLAALEENSVSGGEARDHLKWLRFYLDFCAKYKHPPRDPDSKDARGFFTHLAVDRHVAASTQNQAFNALLFLYRHILQREP